MNGHELSVKLGVSEATVSRLLSGKRKPSTSLMLQIRDTLKTKGRPWTIDKQMEALAQGTYGAELLARMTKAPGKNPHLLGERCPECRCVIGHKSDCPRRDQ